MPFKSQKQRAYFYSQLPELAEKWEAHTPKGKKLPKYAPKKKKHKKTKAEYHALIVKVAASARDYYAHLTPEQMQLLITLPNKNNPGTAWAALKSIEILKEYSGAVTSLVHQKQSPESIVQRMLEAVKGSVEPQIFDKIKDVAKYVAEAMIQKAGRVSRASVLNREPIDDNEKFENEENAHYDNLADKSEYMSMAENGISPEDQRLAFRKTMLKKLS